jgi:hypothetical protein
MARDAATAGAARAVGAVRRNQFRASRETAPAATPGAARALYGRSIVCSRAHLVFGRAHPGSRSITFAHVCALLRGSIISGSAEMVDFGIQIDPHNGLRRAVFLSLRFSCKFVGPVLILRGWWWWPLRSVVFLICGDPVARKSFLCGGYCPSSEILRQEAA